MSHFRYEPPPNPGDMSEYGCIVYTALKLIWLNSVHGPGVEAQIGWREIMGGQIKR